MLFTKKTWKDRKTEYPNRRALAKEDGSRELVTVSREEGVISEEGDAFSAENMNDLETRVQKAIGSGDIPEELGADIVAAISKLNSKLSSVFRAKLRSTSVYRVQELNKPVVIDRFEEVQKQQFIGVIVRILVEGLINHDVYLFKNEYGFGCVSFNISYGLKFTVRGNVELRNTDIIMNIYDIQGWGLGNVSNVRIDWITR